MRQAKHVLVAVDSTAASEHMLKWACDSLISTENGDVLDLLHVVPATIARSHVAASLGYTPDLHEGQIEEKFMKQAREYIKSHHGKVIESTGNTRYRLLLKQAASSSGTADIADAIIASAKETGAALICVSRNQKSVLQSYFVGSTSEEVLRKSSVPTLLFPGPSMTQH